MKRSIGLGALAVMLGAAACGTSSKNATPASATTPAAATVAAALTLSPAAATTTVVLTPTPTGTATATPGPPANTPAAAPTQALAKPNAGSALAATGSAPPSAGPASTVASSAPAGAGRFCENADLRMDNYDGMGLRAPNVKSIEYFIGNASSTPCRVGDFALGLFLSNGDPDPQLESLGSTETGFNYAMTTFTLPPGAEAIFYLIWHSVPTGNENCAAIGSAGLGTAAPPPAPGNAKLVMIVVPPGVSVCGPRYTVTYLSPGKGTNVAPTFLGGATSPAAAGLDRCHTGQLKATLAGTEGAAGTTHDTFNLTNTAVTACTFYGYVGGQMLDAQGKPLPTTIVRGQGTASINDAPVQFTLQPGASATFIAEWSAVPSGGESSCPRAINLIITPPDETATLTAALSSTSFAPCNKGTIHVSPVRAPK